MNADRFRLTSRVHAFAASSLDAYFLWLMAALSLLFLSYRNPIAMTFPTRALSPVLLLDSARIFKEASFRGRLHESEASLSPTHKAQGHVYMHACTFQTMTDVLNLKLLLV